MTLVIVLLDFLICCGLLALANAVGSLSWKRAMREGELWTEAARRLWPVRSTALGLVMTVPGAVVVIQHWSFPDLPFHWALYGWSGTAGALVGCFPLDRDLRPQLTWRSWLHHVVAGWFPKICLWSLWWLALLMMPTELGWQAFGISLIYLVPHLLFAFGAVLRYFRWVRFMTPADARLLEIVRSSVGDQMAALRGIWILESVEAQAYAIVTSREFIFSRALLELCNDAELKAVCDHEWAHLTESRATALLRIVSGLQLYPLLFAGPVIHAYEHGLLLLIWGNWGLSVFARRLALKMEKRADAAVQTVQGDPQVYATALEKIYIWNRIPAVTSKGNRQTHPNLYDRMLAAGVTPAYPRPTPPDPITWIGFVYFVIGGLWIGYLFEVVRR